jgi:hypothetical protein
MTRIDAVTFRLFPTGVCLGCYNQLQASTTSCFGKMYHEEECPKECPDREICPLFQSGEIKSMLELTEERRLALLALVMEQSKSRRRLSRKARMLGHPFMKGSILRQVFDLCERGTTLEEIREFCSAIGVDAPDYTRVLYRGFANGYEWETLPGMDGLSGRPWKIKLKSV